MTVMAAEAGDTAVESEAADSADAGRKATGDKPRKHRVRTAAASAAGPEAGAASAALAKRQSSRQGGSQRRASTSRGGQSRGFPGGGNPARGSYHGVLLAEWAVGSLLIIAIPFSKPNQTGVSPYTGKDLVQLGTYTVVFWLLAIFAATGRGQARFAAWFGGLILLAVGLAEASSIATAVKDWLGGGTTSTSTATSAAGTTTQTTGNASVVNAPSTETATGISRAVAQAPGNGLS